MLSISQNRSDSDGWQWWVAEYPLSYHATKEGAEARIKSNISDEIDRLNDWLVDNPSWRITTESQMQNIRDNVVYMSVGDNGHGSEKCELFVITPLVIED